MFAFRFDLGPVKARADIVNHAPLLNRFSCRRAGHYPLLPPQHSYPAKDSR